MSSTMEKTFIIFILVLVLCCIGIYIVAYLYQTEKLSNYERKSKICGHLYFSTFNIFLIENK